MSLRIKSLADLPKNSVVIVYDLEGIGDVSNPQSCFIWNMSAMVLGSKNNVFDQYIDPTVSVIPEPPNPNLFQVTRQFLRSANAQPMKAVLTYFCQWIKNNYNMQSGMVVLVSHGNFRYDQPLLQTEMVRCGIRPPPNLFFLDTLHWFRSIKKKQKSYSLGNLYKAQFGRKMRNAHLAIFDVKALNDIIQAQDCELSGIMYKCFSTALLRIPSVGLCTESVLYDREISNVEMLVLKFVHKHSYSMPSMTQELVRMNIRPCIANTITQYVAGLAY